MPSFAPCLHEEADTSICIFDRAMEAAKRPSKKISSCDVDTDVVVLVIPVVQQLGEDELRGWQKSPAIVGLKSNCLAFFHSLTRCNKRSFILGLGKRRVSLPAVTGYFVKMNSLPEKPPTDYICTIERFIIILHGRTSKHLHKHRHG